MFMSFFTSSDSLGEVQFYPRRKKNRDLDDYEKDFFQEDDDLSVNYDNFDDQFEDLDEDLGEDDFEDIGIDDDDDYLDDEISENDLDPDDEL